MKPHVPALAPLVHRKHAEHHEQEHLLLLGAASDNHGPGSGHSTRSEPRMCDGPRKRAAARHAMTLHPVSTLQSSSLKPLIELDSPSVNFLVDNIYI